MTGCGGGIIEPSEVERLCEVKVLLHHAARTAFRIRNEVGCSKLKIQTWNVKAITYEHMLTRYELALAASYRKLCAYRSVK